MTSLLVQKRQTECRSEKRQTVRNCSIDLLRILMMFLVVLRHGSYLSGAISVAGIPRFNYLTCVVITNFTGIAVNCFVLISGYFLCKQSFRIERILKLYLTTLFYSLCIAMLAYLYPNFHLTKQLLFRSIFPICTGFSWFMSLYIALSILSPFINITLCTLTQKQFIALLGIQLFFFSLVPSFGLSTFSPIKGYTLIWFIVLYCAGAYLRLYGKKGPACKELFFFLLFCLLSHTFLLLRFVLKKKGIILVHPDNYDFLPTFFASFFCFRLFLTIKLPSCLDSCIMTISPLMLGCYLFHNHYLKHVLWKDLLKINKHIDDSSWFVHMLVCVCIVFIAGCIIEYIRQRLFNGIQRSLERLLYAIKSK